MLRAYRVTAKNLFNSGIYRDIYFMVGLVVGTMNGIVHSLGVLTYIYPSAFWEVYLYYDMFSRASFEAQKCGISYAAV